MFYTPACKFHINLQYYYRSVYYFVRFRSETPEKSISARYYYVLKTASKYYIGINFVMIKNILRLPITIQIYNIIKVRDCTKK